MASLLLGYIGVVLGYILPLMLVYHFAYNRSGGILTMLFLFLMTYLIGFLANMLFYRMALKGESGQISQMSQSKVKEIAGTTFACYTMVAVTLFAITMNRSLIEIFENTIGYKYIQFMGADQFANSIFSSKTMNTIKDNTSISDFNYGFLLTQFNSRNIQQFIEYFTESCQDQEKSKEEGQSPSKLPFDFVVNFENQEQVDKLEDFVNMKHRIGHFSWVYFTSIAALTVSMVAMSMN